MYPIQSRGDFTDELRSCSRQQNSKRLWHYFGSWNIRLTDRNLSSIQQDSRGYIKRKQALQRTTHQYYTISRRAGQCFGGLVYHIWNRAAVRLRLFKKPEDYAAFNRILHRQLSMFGIVSFSRSTRQGQPKPLVGDESIKPVNIHGCRSAIERGRQQKWISGAANGCYGA